MNFQDFHNLQEAYLDVVMNEEKRKYPYSKVHNQNIRLQRNASSETDPEKQEAKYKQADRHREIHTRVRNLPYHQLGNPENRLKPNGKTTSNSTSSQSKQTNSGETTAQRARRDPEFRRQMIRDRMKTMSNEGYDLYDIILSHLLDEGYAETPEAALAIMGNMGEEWRESIVEEMFNEELTGERRKRAIKLGYKELATGKEGSRTTENPDKNLPTKRSGGGVRRNPEWSNPGQSLGAAKVDVTGKKESDRGSGNKAARRAGKKVKDNEDRYYWNDEDPDF